LLLRNTGDLVVQLLRPEMLDEPILNNNNKIIHLNHRKSYFLIENKWFILNL
jgi:hypothetical protein